MVHPGGEKYVYDIRSLNPEHLGLMSGTVQQHNGEALAFIHPFFDIEQCEYGVSAEGLKTNTSLIRQLICEVPRVVFVFEQESDLDSTLTALVEYPRVAPVCLIPTPIANPTPFLLPRPAQRWYITSVEASKQWQATALKMTEIGVRRIYLGGRVYQSQDGKPVGCVPEAARRFRNKGFEVICTEACYPGSLVTRRKRVLLEKFGISPPSSSLNKWIKI